MTNLSVGIGVQPREKAVEIETDVPFRIAILGDFSGSGQWKTNGALRPVEIDPSTFEEVMRRLNVALELPGGALRFGKLDDFHPDQLCQHVARFESMCEAKTQHLRAILGHPDFQSLEAAWRALFFFFRYVETGPELRVELIDVAQSELRQKLPELHGIFATRQPHWSVLVGLYTFSACEADCELLARLGALARMSGAPFLSGIDARLFGCESIGATPHPEDWRRPLPEEHQQAWQRLRQSDDASWIGLAFPRFLLRLPYGKSTSPIDSFDFEEMPGAPPHDAYLWGNPAIACACLLGQEFNREQWEMRARSMARIDGIPLHTFPDREPTPPAEIWMSEQFAAQIAEAGVMPLASVKESDAIVLVRSQSIADPAQPLAGPW